ncbi:MAG: aromatic ring-hydroxylating dioxygenase subunit alpha [Proteobacteria bacterium]|nr:aromatic ring-hydroxylating dioxygenase subunit alpha [Pseudomonadota bacterium]
MAIRELDNVRAGVTENVASDLGETRVPVTRARHMPGYIYTSPEIFGLEKERIFTKDWLCVARVEEIEHPGDYLTLRILREPIILARDGEGNLNVFANVCRHRGVEVAHGQGNTSLFSCPYHGWRYDLTGRLAGAAYMAESEHFDPTNCRLKPIRFGVWRGWVFINFDPNGEPLEDFVASFEADFAILKMDRCRLFAKHRVELNCNWKFVVENLTDIYHSEVLHAKTFAESINTEKIVNKLTERGGNSAFYDAAPHNPSGKSLFGKMPWMADQSESFARSGFLAPNFDMFSRIDEVHPIVIWPISPTQTQILIYQLFPAEFFTTNNFEQKAQLYLDYMIAIVEEDREMIESLQNAMDTTLFEPGWMSYLERGVHHVITHYLDRMFPS